MDDDNESLDSDIYLLLAFYAPPLLVLTLPGATLVI